MLGVFGFSVRYFSLDGAQTKRDLMKMLLRENVSETMTFMMFLTINCLKYV